MKKVIYIFVLIVAFTSCVKDSNYETPQINCEEPQIPANQLSSIQNVIAQWNAANPTGTTSNIVEFVTDTEASVYISGYVTSDDQTGNFYKELFIQDAAKDPQYAVKILIDVASLYTKFDVGRKVYIKLNGLAINKVRGEIVIGEMINGAFDNIRENRVKKNFTRSCDVVSITPKTITIANISSSMVGMYVKLDEMQFNRTALGSPFVNPLDSYDSYRNMISCVSGELLLETSTFASFKSQILPEGKGSVHGIITRNYDNNAYVLRINNPNVFTFTGQRCDFYCGTATSDASNVLFQDNFNSYGVGVAISANGWTNYMQEGTANWKTYSDTYSLGVSASLNPFNNGSTSVKAWLITPLINMDAQNGEVLSFKTSNSFSDSSTLDVLISNNWDGNVANISTATWQIVSAAIVVPDNTYYQAWIHSSFINLSCATGNTYIAFRYKGDGGGSASTFNGTYELDEVKITSN